MRSVCFPLAIIAVLALPAGAAPVAPPMQLIAHIDSVIATMDSGNVLIQARGAVNSGGWRQRRLRPLKGDAHTFVMEFVATPPASTRTVIEGLLPIHAAATLRMRRGVVAVRVVSDSNEITTEILK